MTYGLTKSANFVRASSQFLSHADNAGLEVSNITMEGWINIASFEPGTHQNTFMMTKGANSSIANASYAFYFADNSIGMYICDGVSNFDSPTVSWSPSTSTWYHVAGSYDTSAKEAKFYVDGSQQGSTVTGLTCASINNSTEDFTLGAGKNIISFPPPYRYGFMDGNMSLFRIWNAVRTQSEINNNKCSVLGSTTALKAEWTLDNTLNDNSGAGLTLTDNNSVTFTSSVPSICAPAATTNPAFILNFM